MDGDFDRFAEAGSSSVASCAFALLGFRAKSGVDVSEMRVFSVV